MFVARCDVHNNPDSYTRHHEIEGATRIGFVPHICTPIRNVAEVKKRG